MQKIRITKGILGIGHNHNDCIYCGLNTNLLPENERIESDYKRYCRRCYLEGVHKKFVTPGDFFAEAVSHTPSTEEIQQDLAYRQACLKKCQTLRGIEIAHLHGEKGLEGEMHLDLFFDNEGGDICFRVTICDDDDPWFGSETRDYISPDRAIELLNKNNIHILDGLTAENWTEYFDFSEL